MKHTRRQLANAQGYQPRYLAVKGKIRGIFPLCENRRSDEAEGVSIFARWLANFTMIPHPRYAAVFC